MSSPMACGRPVRFVVPIALATLMMTATGYGTAAFALTADDHLASTKRFSFHANPWINLHHFLHHAATHPDVVAEAAVDSVSPEDRAVLAGAVEHYREQLAERDLLFDGELFRLKRWLVEQDAGSSLPRRDELAATVDWLNRVRPVYDREFWPAQLERSEETLARNLDAIRRWEKRAVKRLARLTDAKWPKGRIRVDLSYYANWAGAYTTVRPEPHVVVSTGGERVPGDWIETIFHESAHTLIGRSRGAVAVAIEEQAAALNEPVPRGLWHAILFYLAGRVVEDLYEAENAGQYELYMVRENVFDDDLPELRACLEPYLSGDVDLDGAVRNLIESINRRKSPGKEPS